MGFIKGNFRESKYCLELDRDVVVIPRVGEYFEVGDARMRNGVDCEVVAVAYDSDINVILMPDDDIYRAIGKI